MKNTTLSLLLIAPLCCLGETSNTSVRDYTMVDLRNGLITELLEIGPTSFTFSVEWPLDIKIAEGRLCLMGKLNPETRGWSFLKELDLDPTHKTGPFLEGSWHSRFPVKVDQVQRKATFEILYDELVWYYMEWEKAKFEKKAAFSVRVPVITNSPFGTNKGLYEEDDEEDDEEEKVTSTATVEAGGQDGGQGGVVPSPTGSTDGFQPSGQADTTGATAGDRRYLWLCVGIALALYAVFYFLRKKTRN